jgi:catechol 2,3-dioxygenase-like lactoylglutathione lyase family enzyme
MIKGVHTMFYSSQPDELRSFLRDKLRLESTDVGEGWLIFDVPEAEMGCHPADPANGAPSGMHNISFYCDDLAKTVAELQASGVEITDPIADHGYGLVTFFKAPGDFKVQLYQPRYVKNFPSKTLPAKKREAMKIKKRATVKKRTAKQRTAKKRLRR